MCRLLESLRHCQERSLSTFYRGRCGECRGLPSFGPWQDMAGWDLDPRFGPPAVCLPASLPWGASPRPRRSAPALSGLWPPPSEASPRLHVCRPWRAERGKGALGWGTQAAVEAGCRQRSSILLHRARRGGLLGPEPDCMRCGGSGNAGAMTAASAPHSHPATDHPVTLDSPLTLAALLRKPAM